MVGIIDYGLGNLRSVAAAVTRVGGEAVVTADPSVLAQADKLILPGVGAFGDGMKNLHARGLVETLTQIVVVQGKPILGICLGAQLFARESFEFGHHEGLGWLDASVVRIEPTESALRVPHVGWNDVHIAKPCVLFEGIPDHSLFYFVHSFHLRFSDDTVVVGTCEYGIPLTAVVQKGTIFATQFHPEKSQRCGLQLLENFIQRT
ncbi:MAG: imidazole glycerol phosphate synthase subunit HisH [bacterium]|nr:imidazole glycerol phosphate synthase subunit HisH [bacterium]